MKKFKVILATSVNDVLGLNGKIPWDEPEDLVYFQKMTQQTFFPRQNIVVMGRKTWESLPFKSLSNRRLYVITRNEQNVLQSNVYFFSSFQSAIQNALNSESEHIWVAGGKQIYIQAFHHPNCGEIYWNNINKVILDSNALILNSSLFDSHSKFQRNNILYQVGTMKGVEI